jgi:hypothetical protein
MKNKKPGKKPIQTSDNRAATRTRILQIIFILFSIMLILSMLLSLTQY